ncbi:14 kDa phosphohistidine phosphatase [Galendromus occidentalis]|uniref:14 kDa phosphohistidine phosphatase n=1 Tax=Galendromus occidentalis TaxID=34638 RepID=A0AAJ6VZ52_9ACAR|nr:14 kDa phosphohistidine phosphatase [Galendromus occidentalis]
MEAIPDVKIDDGRFKYVLIRVHDKNSDDSKLIVRGSAKCSYHMDIYELAQKEIERDDRFDLEPQGGGRILHNAKEKRIEVFGYSVDLGQAKHTDTCDILKKHFAEYPPDNIIWTNEGY